MSAVLHFVQNPLVAYVTVVVWGVGTVVDETITKRRKRARKEHDG